MRGLSVAHDLKRSLGTTTHRRILQARCVRTLASRNGATYHDVAIIGGGSIGLAAAASLARRGVKVVLIGNFDSSHRKPPTTCVHHVRLPHEDPFLADLSQEAYQFWKGLEWNAKGVFQETGTLDIGPTDSSPAGAALGGLMSIGQGTGCQTLTAGTANLEFPGLRLQGGLAALWCPQGGTIDGNKEAKALKSLVERSQGSVRDDWHLEGWEDKGSHFLLHVGHSPKTRPSVMREVETLDDMRSTELDLERQYRNEPSSNDSMPASRSASSSCEDEAWLEVEQVVLCPPVWPTQSLALFGAEYDVQVALSRTYSAPLTGSLTASFPSTRLLLPASSRSLDQGRPCYSHTMLTMDSSSGRCQLHQPPLEGRQLFGQELDIKSPEGDRRAWVQSAVAAAQSAAPSLFSDYWDEGLNTRGGREDQADGLNEMHGFLHHYVTRDQRPALGWHSSFQSERLAIALPSSGGLAGGIDGYQLNPVIGRAAADMCMMRGQHALSAPEYQLNRPGIQVASETDDEEDHQLEEVSSD